MLQAVDPWMSEENLAKGKPWFDELRKALDEILYGVFCVTEESQESQWMSWEAGLLSASSVVGEKRVAPLVIGMPKGSLRGPLSIYQATETTYDDVLRLVKNINLAMTDGRSVPDNRIEGTFQLAWPTLENLLSEASSIPVESHRAPVKTDDRLDKVVALLRDTQRQIGETKGMVNILDLRTRSLMVLCRFSEPLDPGGPEILKSFPPVRVRISQNLSPL